MNDFSEVIEYIDELKQEGDLSRRFLEKTNKVVEILNNEKEMAIEKALGELEELNSMDLPSYHRTRVWDIISILEGIKR